MAIGSFALAPIYLTVAYLASTRLPQEWQTIIGRAFFLSFAGAIAAAAYVNWRYGQAGKHERGEKPE
jgi:hypothetical protein